MDSAAGRKRRWKPVSNFEKECREGENVNICELFNFTKHVVEFNNLKAPVSSLSEGDIIGHDLSEMMKVDQFRSYVMESFECILNPPMLQFMNISLKYRQHENLILGLVKYLHRLYPEDQFGTMDGEILEKTLRSVSKMMLRRRWHLFVLMMAAHYVAHDKSSGKLGKLLPTLRSDKYVSKNPILLTLVQILKRLVKVIEEKNRREKKQVGWWSSDNEEGSSGSGRSLSYRVTLSQGIESMDPMQLQLNHMVSLDIPKDLFTSKDFDWVIPFYVVHLEEHCEDYFGDLMSLNYFYDLLVERLKKPKLYSQLVHRTLIDIVDRNPEVTTTYENEKVLLDLMLDKMNLKVADFVRISKTLQGLSGQDEGQSCGAAEPVVKREKRGEAATMERHRKLCWMILDKLKDDLVDGIERKINSSDKDACLSIFRTSFRHIVQNHAADAAKNGKWFRRMMDDPEVVSVLKFVTAFAATSQTTFVESLWVFLYGNNWDMNPLVCEQRDLFLDLTKEREEEARPAEECMVPLSLAINLMDYQPPHQLILEKIVLWRDVGLIFEYPIHFTFHVVFAFIEAMEDLEEEEPIVSPQVNKTLKKLSKFWDYGQRPKTAVKTVILAHELSKAVGARSGEHSVPAFLNRNCFKKCLKKLKKAHSRSVCQLFYSSNHEFIVAVLERYFNDTAKSVTPDFIKVLVDVLLGVESVKHDIGNNKSGVSREKVRFQRNTMKKLWDFNPFQRKLEALRTAVANETYVTVFREEYGELPLGRAEMMDFLA